jgi:hypothetical protein
MTYESIDVHTFSQCCKVKLKVRLTGVHLEKGDEVLVFHKFRIYKPEKAGALGKNDKYIAFDVDGQLFENFFTVIEHSEVEKVRINAQKALDAQKAKKEQDAKKAK